MSTYILTTEKEYELIDSGEGMKLERFGTVVLARPDPEALWPRRLPQEQWDTATAQFERKGATGTWNARETLPASWNLSFAGLQFELRPTSFKHVGIFPEQKIHWDWMSACIASAQKENKKNISVLNLFAYTGGASLVAAAAGAEVTHLDSSKVAIEWARKNAQRSGLSEKPIRWIEDDVLTFLRREVKRGNKYDGIVMDPPAFGHGKGDKLWKIERDFYELFSLVKEVLSDDPLFLIVNGYTAGYSPLTLLNNVQNIQEKYGGVCESGELAIPEKEGSRLLPAGVFARWKHAE